AAPHRPGVGAHQAATRREVVRVAPEVVDRSFPVGRLCQPIARAADTGDETGADVAPAGHRGQVVHLAQQLDLLQPLEYAEAERRAADAAARDGEADEIVHVLAGAD